MKHFILFVCYIVLANSTNAQIKKGQFLAGGNISFESEKYQVRIGNVPKTTTFLISPNLGYFIVPKFAIGLRTDFGIYKNTSSPTTTYLSLNPFLRYYLLSQKCIFNFLVDVGYTHSKSKLGFQNQPMPYLIKSFGYTISLGPSLFINEHVSLEFLFNFKHDRTKYTHDIINKINTGLGLQVHLGKLKPRHRSIHV